jgi:glycolate oxidase
MTLTDILQTVFDKTEFSTAPGDRDAFTCQTPGCGRYRPAAVCRPARAGALAAFFQERAARDLGVIPAGAGLRIPIPAVPETGIVVSTGRMNRIVDLDARSLTVRVEAGVRFGDLQPVLSSENRFFPADPLHSEATVGGAAADGAGGPAAAGYGVMKQFVLGMEIVTPEGVVVQIGGGTMKNVVGYDLVSLYCGSGGRLGVITALTLRLLPGPPERRGLLAAFRDPRAACTALRSLIDTGAVVRAALLDPLSASIAAETVAGIPGEAYLVFAESAGIHLDRVPAAAGMWFDEAESVRAVEDPDDVYSFWQTREAIHRMIRRRRTISGTLFVPRNRFADLFTAAEAIRHRWGMAGVCRGANGAGGFHPVLFPGPYETERACRAILEMGEVARNLGGNAADPFLWPGLETAEFDRPEPDAAAREIQHRLKRALDPQNRLKPDPAGDHPSA